MRGPPYFPMRASSLFLRVCFFFSSSLPRLFGLRERRALDLMSPPVFRFANNGYFFRLAFNFFSSFFFRRVCYIVHCVLLRGRRALPREREIRMRFSEFSTFFFGRGERFFFGGCFGLRVAALFAIVRVFVFRVFF